MSQREGGASGEQGIRADWSCGDSSLDDIDRTPVRTTEGTGLKASEETERSLEATAASGEPGRGPSLQDVLAPLIRVSCRLGDVMLVRGGVGRSRRGRALPER